MEIKDVFLRIFLASLIGILIGRERKQSGKPAGMSTHLVVCLGATILTIIQVKINYDIVESIKANPNLANVLKADITRIPAQIVSGIGFLGAGLILQSKDSIKGITTASIIWITAVLGIGIGYGFYEIVVPTTAVLLLALAILKRHGVFSEIAEEIEKRKDVLK